MENKTKTVIVNHCYAEIIRKVVITCFIMVAVCNRLYALMMIMYELNILMDNIKIDFDFHVLFIHVAVFSLAFLFLVL